MGFRLASLRRTNVVMAPACTCIIFVQDFSIFIENYHPIGVSVRASDNFQTCVKQLQLMCVKVFCIIFVIKKTERHVNRGEIFGCVRVIYPCKDVLNEKSVEYLTDNTYTLDALKRIMNESDSMGDKKDTMGLQKIDMPNFDGNLSVKEKPFAPGVDILSTLEREMCRNGTNFQQDCEEFFQIIATNAEKAAPAAATNGQVNPPEQNDASSENLASFERVLLNEVDDINMEEDHVTDTPAENSISYVDDGEEKRKKCLQMERRIDRLTRRLKMKQSKVFGLHTSEQICSLLDFCRCKSSDGSVLRNESDTHSESSIDFYLKRLKSCSNQSCLPQNSEKFAYYFGSGAKETKNGRSFGLTVAPKLNLDVHEHIEKISGQLHAQIKAIASDFDSDATASSSGNDSLDEESSLPPPTVEDKSKKLPLSKRAIWRWLRNRASIAYRLSWLQSHMSALEYKIHHYTEIYKKLRSAKGQVVLQNNVTVDQNGALMVKSASTPGTPIAASTAIAAALTGGTTTHVILNGYHGSLTTSPVTTALPTTAISAAKNESTMSPDYCPPTPTSCCDSDDACSRTRPLLRSKFRKRNIIRLDEATQNNCTANAASGNGFCSKYGSSRCDCVAPLCCILCVNRGPGVDLSNQHICSNLLPTQSKIALLEPTFHPVLSFAQNVSVSTHICALLNNDGVIEVCGKTIESRSFTPNVTHKRHYTNYKSTEEIRRSNSENMELYKRRKKYARRQPNNSQSLAYGRGQLGKRRLPKYLSDKALSFKKRRRKRLRTKRYKEAGLDESADEGLYYKKEETLSSQPGSPQSSHSSTVKDPTTANTTTRRKRGQSYDIDNFIIPPNSTPATVAIKPQYKEILIPTWKIVEEKTVRLEDIDKRLIPADILDDIDEDKIIELHEILEQNERKKFKTKPTRNKGQGRSRKRTDSCPETSEANTPERVASPVSTTSEADTTTVTANLTVALTPITFPSQGNGAMVTTTTTSTSTNTNTTNAVRTASLIKTKTNLDCDNSTVTESVCPEITPYEERKFPLSDAEFNEMLSSDPNKSDDEKETDDNEPANDVKPNQIESREHTEGSESTDSVSEDPDDPDWMLNEGDLSRPPIELIRK